MMLRAATAASGGTGAPFATYCSIWAWTVRIRAWVSMPSGVTSGSSSTRARRYGSDWLKPWTRRRDWPWTMARTVPSWSCTTWAILASVPMLVQLGGVVDVLLLGLALGDEGDRAAFGDGRVERVDALLPADLERDDHLREDDGLAQGDEGQVADRPSTGAAVRLFDGVCRVAWPWSALLTCGCGVGAASAGPASMVASVGWGRGCGPAVRVARSPRRRGPRGSARRGAPRARTGCGCRRG